MCPWIFANSIISYHLSSKFHKILPSYEAEPYIIQFTGCGMFMSAAYKVNGEEKLNLMIVSDAIPADAKLYQAAHSHVSRTHMHSL